MVDGIIMPFMRASSAIFDIKHYLCSRKSKMSNNMLYYLNIRYKYFFLNFKFKNHVLFLKHLYNNLCRVLENEMSSSLKYCLLII